MTAKTPAEIKHDEIACLARLNWQQDGCPQGRDLDYWLEAESQLKATWHLLATERPPLVGGQPAPKKSKLRSNGTLKTAVRPRLEQCI